MIPFYSGSTVQWNASASIASYTGWLNYATSSANIFGMFKQHPAFTGPVGITAGDYAAFCLSHSKACPSASILPVSAAKNDTYGSPFSNRLSGSGLIGWDTCRFMSTMAYIAENFTGSMNGKTIYEFGSCYGGLVSCMLQQWPSITTYWLNDLPEVVNFTYYYLNQLSFPTVSLDSDITGSNPPGSPVDLFISEYAITEMDSASMYTIYNTYARPANGILIRSNLQNPTVFVQFLQTCQQDFTCSVIDESQGNGMHFMSRLGNKIIVGYKNGSW